MSAARVSVVVPVLNAGPFLAEALASVRAQTDPPDELIVVDDGSTDDSYEIARRLADTVLQSPGQQGPSFCRNLGVERSSGSLIAFLDADDRWLPSHVHEARAALDSAPSAALSFARVQRFGFERSVSGVRADVPARTAFDARLPLMARNIVAQITVVVRRGVFESVGGYDPTLRFAEDFDLWNRIAARHGFVYVPEITAEYRVHAGQASAQRSKMIQAGWEQRVRHFTHLADAEPLLTARAAMLLTRAWRAETLWAIKIGDYDLHRQLCELRRLVASAFDARGITPPPEVPWSSTLAGLHRVKRSIKSWF